MSRRHARPGGAFAATGWRWPGSRSLPSCCSAVAVGPLVVAGADQRHRFRRAARAARPGAIRSAPTISARTCSPACSTAAASRWRSGWRRWWWRSSVGTIVGAVAGISRGGVDMALMWLTDLFLSLPQLPLLLLLMYLFRDALKTLVGPRARRLRPDRRGDRRVPLDAGGAAGARAVPVAAREGVRRGGAGARARPNGARWCATSCRIRSGR